MLPEPELLGQYFHKLFQGPVGPNKRKADWKKGQKSKAKEKKKSKAEAGPEVALSPPPDVQLPGNPSSLAVFASVRLAVLERWRRQTSQAFLSPGLTGEDGEGESEDDTTDASLEQALKVPKLVGVGLCTVFELLRESRHLHPLLCTKALRALLDVLQGQQPEGLKGEPSDVTDPLFDLLLDLATSHGPESAAANDGSHLTAVACACLMALVVVRGDTGRLLSATAALLMSPRVLAAQNIHMPEVLAALQRSVHGVLLGKIARPDWVTHGVQRASRIDTFHIKLPGHEGPSVIQPGSHALASDGQFLYLFARGALYKLGSGYGGTIKGHLYLQRLDFSTHNGGWLGFANNKLYYKSMGESRSSTHGVYIVDRENLTLSRTVELPDSSEWGPGALFSDGETLGAITSAKEDGFAVRSLTGSGNPEVLSLKLARKCVEVWGNVGAGSGDEAADNAACVTINTGCDDETALIFAGKDFSLIRTINGKVLYSGKGSSLGLKQAGGGSGGGIGPGKWSRWSELPVTKSPRINLFAVGHEGMHAVLVAEDGAVFFTGTARRGEDGDQSKARRQPKPVKPKKMIKVDGQFVVHAACNNGTTALVTREGELLMFGKDTAHCDHASGLVTSLKEVDVRKVALGKAHAVVLTSKGHVYTFGINNKGQCGRDFTVQVREAPAVVAMETAGEEGEEEGEGEWEEAPEGMCPPGRHRWRQDKCMICTVCRECTGYSISCLSSMRPDRNPGQACGCGAGDSGCATCGCCRICARESVDNSEVAILGPSGAGDLGGMVRLDLIFGGRHSARLQDHLQRRLEERKQRLQRGGKAAPISKLKIKSAGSHRLGAAAGVLAAVKAGPSRVEPPSLAAGLAAALIGEEGGGSDVERDASRVTSLAPARVIIPSESPAIQVSCGLHHTLVLLQSGEVYAFGSNSCGQLGVGDIIAHGGPVLVRVPGTTIHVAAGSNHSVFLTASGEVFTAGSFQKGQLGRQPSPVDDSNGTTGASVGGATRKASSSKGSAEGPWYAVPGLIPLVGPQHGRRATWVGASGDLSFVKVDESLINASSLAASTVMANRNSVVILPTENDHASSFRCLVINKLDGNCSSFSGHQQVDFSNCAACLDPLYNVLWSFHRQTGELSCHNPIAADISPLPALLAPELALPVTSGCFVTRTQAALHLLGCVDTLTSVSEKAGTSLPPRLGDSEASPLTTRPTVPTVPIPSLSASHRAKVYSSEDFSAVSRFESYGGGWGYSGHSIEAIRFMSDTDLLVGGFGLFGGRGEYTGKIKLYDIGMDGGEQEIDGELLAETEDVPFECAPRQKYPMLFDEPVMVQANRWYVAWARVGGPSSDCGSSGQGMVTTEDQVVFCFKSSRRANNGTDVNGGQIPQILYRVIVPESQTPSRQLDQMEPVYHLSKSFSKTVTKECFESLLALLQWSWNTFKAGLIDITHVTGTQNHMIAVLDLERLVFISQASLRLLRTFTNELYPNELTTKKLPTENPQLATCIGDVRSLLRQILSDTLPHLKRSGKSRKRDTGMYSKMISEILQEAHQTFVSCFHAFYPTASLRWSSLCHLLGEMEKIGPQSSLDRLLSAVLASLCHPAVRLRSTFPILGVLEHTTLPLPKETHPPPSYSSSSSPDSSSPSSSSASSSTTANHTQAIAGPSQPISPDTNCALPLARGSPEAHHYPLLVEHMIYRGQVEEGLGSSSWQFKDVLERLLDIVTLPVSQALCRDKVSHSAELTHHCCHLVARVIAELASQSSGSDEELEGACGRVMHISPSRFTRCNQCRTWNTGNGSPDAICFSVDRPGVAIVGVCVYGGVGTYEYELELLDDQNSGGNDPSHSQRWNSLEIARGTFGPDDCVSDVTELKFEKPVAIKENVKYAVRLRNHGGRTSNGDGGLSSVRGPDGTTFTFSTCSLSFNGTTQTRGQIPQILYYSSPQDSESQQTSRALAEMQARKCTLTLAGAVIKRSASLLALARSEEQPTTAITISQEILGTANIITTLLPLVLAHISPVATSDPRSAVQVLGLIQELLPNVSALNLATATMVRSTGSLDSSGHQDLSNASALGGICTTSMHHAYVESDHPYKPASVSNYRVAFPDNVKWISVEFDPQCGTAQPEDSLQIFIPAMTNTLLPHHQNVVNKSQDDEDNPSSPFWPVLHKFSGTNNWPQMAVVLPGNEVIFSLETASDYVLDEKANTYGFRCLVVGYEWPSTPGDGLRHLECELAFLGGMCAASLMKKDLQLPPASVEEVDEDIEAVEEVAQQVYQQNSALLGKGFALASPPTIHQALEGVLPFSYQSIERQFLRDLVQCAPGTSGGRLARWLQPESYVEPRRCEVLYSRDDMRCGWPAIVTILSKDQYGQLVHAPNLRIEVKAVPIDKGELGEQCSNNEHQMTCQGRKSRRISEPDALTFGGHPQPSLEVPYEVTMKDKMCYHSISIMKAYENYSFEELRYMSPAVRRSSENMLVRPNADGTYSATWTPASTGWYSVLVTVDGYALDEVYRVEVKDPPQGITPPVPTVVRRAPHQPSRLRKFVAKYSAGLRIRAHPSLQSEQIGIVTVNGVISFVDEIHNDDGVWLRLSGDTIRQLCSTGHPEAWCLQYNQHLGKTLLLPVEEPKTILDEVIRETILKKLPEAAQKEGRQVGSSSGGGPGMYQVVKCGASGHNVRSRPSLTAPPVGMLVLGNHVMIVDDVVNQEGTWVQLDSESKKEFCFNPDGEAWSLAMSRGDVIYLQHEGDPDRDLRPERQAQSADNAFNSPRRGFDFSNRHVPNFAPAVEPSVNSGFNFGSVANNQKDPGSAGSTGSTGNPFVFGSQEKGSPRVCDKPEIAPKPVLKEGGKLSVLHKWLRGEEVKLPSPPPLERRISQPSAPPIIPGRDLPPELMGVSVKELVKAIGESRANGNGVTPPGTPRRPSRSSSPKAPGSVLPGPATMLAAAVNSRSSSPVPIPPGKGSLGVQESTGSSPACGSPRSMGISPLVSTAGPVNMVTADSGRRGSTQSDTSALVSSLTRDLSHSPSCSSLQMRSDTPNSLHGQEATAIPSSPKVTQTGTQTSPEGSLSVRGGLHFSLGDAVTSTSASTAAGGATVAARVSPKLGRKDRSSSKGSHQTGGTAQLRSKRERPHSPKDHHRSASGRHHTRGTSPATPMNLSATKEPVKEAITPSVAECLRAVFAAFLWHEGIVHDAMACASFLKFHPGLPKQGALVITRQPTGVPGNLTAAEKIKQRHSVEVSASNYLHIQPSTLETLTRSAANANANRSRKKHDSAGVPNTSNAIKEEEGNMAHSATAAELGATSAMQTVTVLPPALRSLVLLWEDLSSGCLRAIQGQVLLLPSPMLLMQPCPVRPPSANMRRPESAGSRPPSASAVPTPMVQVGKERDRERRGRKKKEWKPMGRGAVFGDPWYMVMRPMGAQASGGQGSSRDRFSSSNADRETVCELCGGSYPHPVTFHMRTAHPGCGETAGGKGYNSGGNFCVGWAGNCGDGGVGGSTWYLICDSCRDRYLRQRKQLGKESSGNKKSKKKSSNSSLAPSTPASKLLSPMTQLETHIVMKNNAMFLLDLASAASRDPPPSSPPLRRSPHGMPSLSEQIYEEGPFPSLASGLPGFQCLSTLGVHPSQVRQLSEEHLLAETLRQNGEQGLERFLEGIESKPSRPVSECNLSDSEDSLRGRPFHRSISMGTTSKDWNNGRVVMMRKRNNSSGETNEAGSSLLCHPSAALQKLIPSELSCTISISDENMPRPASDLMDRPVIAFILQQHNLESLQLAMKQAIRKSACRVYAMQALTWLLRSVTQPTCLHDLLWWFVAALTPATEYPTPTVEQYISKLQPTDNEGLRHERPRTEEPELRACVCEHPLSDLAVGGEAVRPLPSAFHSLLQAVADLMLLLPMGSALQQMAVRCWGIRFRHSDHGFLHRSHVFSNISKILSRSEEEDNIEESHHSAFSCSLATAATASVSCCVETLKDLTPGTDIKASSRQAMVASLTDASTETFWESSDEDRNKTKFITLTCPPSSSPRMVYVHIDNCRDLANKVSSVAFQSGPNAEEMYKLQQLEVEARYSGWVSCPILESRHSVVKLELRGPDNSLRIRQVRVLGEMEGESLRASKQHSATTIQQRNCEAETLRVFRLITSQVFGKLIVGGEPEESLLSEEVVDGPELAKTEDSNDLREHMVGILFSRSKLTHLQRQVCVHIVQAIRKESLRVREEWEALLCSGGTQAAPQTVVPTIPETKAASSDTYCFEMLSMVLALSGSSVGRAYLSQQYGLLRDLLSLLHTGSARVQRQVTSLLRRMLPEIPPATLAMVMGVERLPPPDFSIVSAASKSGSTEPAFDMHRVGILDVFLSVIAKALTVQVRVKGGGSSKDAQGKGVTTASLATSIHPRAPLGHARWWLRGCISRKLSDGIINLLKDMAAGKLSDAWAEITKGAVAENILNLTKLPESSRSPQECLSSPTLWLALASLCVLDAEHVERLSSGQWSAADGQPAPPRPTCSNHDDGETAAIIQCNVCGNLCAECDRILHLHRRTRLHQRQVCKEEEEAIKVDLHEGCGRTKLFWLLALADSSTLKALVEFRDRVTRSKPAGTVSAGVCRFCGATGSSGLLAIGNVCADQECQEHARNACSKLHNCGHMCGGIQGESPCLPCLHNCARDPSLKQDADDMCMICFTDALSCAPAIQLKCGHVFHLHCCKSAVSKRWAGPRITFAFAQCPICKSDMAHPTLTTVLAPVRELFDDVRRKALMRLEYEGLHRAEAIVSPGARFHNDAASYAMDRYAYYVCFKCKKAYYGGEARCDADAGITEDYDPSELVCGACSDVSRAQMCPKHGTDFLEYKCRYCCSVAVFFCFGTTHFCNPCHDDFQRVTNLPKHELPRCPAGPRAKQLEGEECPLHIKHPSTGEEFALGCGVCRNAHTF